MINTSYLKVIITISTNENKCLHYHNLWFKHPFSYDKKINASLSEFKSHKWVNGFTTTCSVTQFCNCMDIDFMQFIWVKQKQTRVIMSSFRNYRWPKYRKWQFVLLLSLITVFKDIKFLFAFLQMHL